MIQSNKILFLLTSALLAITLLGCSNTEDKKVEKSSGAGKIEVTQNENKYEIKVKKEEKTGDESFYYTYKKNQKGKSPYEDLNLKSPYEEVEISLLEKKLSKNFLVKCAPCHNRYANGVIGPSLLHKDAKFIFDTMMEYVNGQKKNVLMKELVKNMDKEELKAISREIASFNEDIRKKK